MEKLLAFCRNVSQSIACRTCVCFSDPALSVVTTAWMKKIEAKWNNVLTEMHKIKKSSSGSRFSLSLPADTGCCGRRGACLRPNPNGGMDAASLKSTQVRSSSLLSAQPALPRQNQWQKKQLGLSLSRAQTRAFPSTSGSSLLCAARRGGGRFVLVSSRSASLTAAGSGSLSAAQHPTSLVLRRGEKKKKRKKGGPYTFVRCGIACPQPFSSEPVHHPKLVIV